MLDEPLSSFALTFILLDFLDVQGFGERVQFHAILLMGFEIRRLVFRKIHLCDQVNCRSSCEIDRIGLQSSFE